MGRDHEKLATREGAEARRRRADLLRRWPVVIACALLAAAAALAASVLQTEEYTANASLLFRDQGFDQGFSGAAVLQSDPEREAATNISLVSLQAIADKTAELLDDNLSGDQIDAKVQIASEGRSDVVTVKATDPDPDRAALIANTFAATYITFRRAADRETVRRARRLVAADFERLTPAERETRAGESLAREISRLQALEALQTGNAELVESAEPPSRPSSPRTARNVVLGGALGLLFGVGLAALLGRLDRRLREPREFEEVLGLPLLATIASTKQVSAEDDIGELLRTNPEALQMLRTRLRYFNVDRNIRTVLVTSPAPGDGKTTIAWSLAASATLAGVKAVLVEADFHRSQIAERTGAAPLPGLSELLSGQSSVEGTLQQVGIGEDPSRTLDLIVAGSYPPNSSELLESGGMAKLLRELGDTHELVVVDTPPMARIADAIPLIPLVDGVIVVTRAGRTTRDEAIHFAEQLQELNASTLGFVVNRVSTRRGAGSYGYGYGYGYGSNGDRGGGARPQVGAPIGK